MIIAIDGPAGAGKSTVARAVANRLGITYIDTGAMYRAVALKAIESGVALTDVDAIVEQVGSCRVQLQPAADGTQRVLLDGRDVTKAIRTPSVTEWSSPISAIPRVRTVLVEQQRAMGGAASCVMEGRDIGTVVFPNAEVKVYLTASVGERARRRAAELAAAGVATDPAAVETSIAERDHRDRTREDSPLRRADDAVVIETDGMSIEAVVDAIVSLAREREPTS